MDFLRLTLSHFQNCSIKLACCSSSVKCFKHSGYVFQLFDKDSVALVSNWKTTGTVFALHVPTTVCVRSDCSAGGGSELLMPIIVNGHYGASDGDEEGQQATVLV